LVITEANRTLALAEETFQPYLTYGCLVRATLSDEILRLAAIQRDYARSNEVKKLWQALFEAAGLDSEDTARDRLVLRFQVHSDVGTTLQWARSTATVGFHRDTWGTNLPAQVNWWAPVWPITEGRTFAIHPALWEVHIENNSAEFDLADVMQRLRTAPGTRGLASWRRARSAQSMQRTACLL